MSSPPIVSSPVTSRPQQRDHDVLEMLRIGCRIRTRDPDVRAAAEVDAADTIDRERRDVFDVTVHQPLESVAHANDVHALEGGADGRGADHAVDAWVRVHRQRGWRVSCDVPRETSDAAYRLRSSIIGWAALSAPLAELHSNIASQVSPAHRQRCAAVCSHDGDD